MKAITELYNRIRSLCRCQGDSSYDSKEIIDSCIQRWLYEDERTKYFSSLFPTWLTQMPQKSVSLILHLLSCFCYYPHEVTNKILIELHQKLLSQESISVDDTIFINIKKESGISNSSNDYWIEYKLLNKLSKYSCVDDIHKLSPQQLDAISNIVIVDDCSGTGKTLIKYIEKNIDIFRNKRIYCNVVHVMQKAIDNINEFKTRNNINIIVNYSFVQDKAFNDPYFHNDQSLKNTFIKVSKDLKIHNDHILGYEESEGLFAFYNNTPNNTLGLFWYDNDIYKSPFPRNNDVRPAWMSAGKTKRNTQNYYSRIR